VDFNTLISAGILNGCKYVEVVQVVLLQKRDNICWNYFTHVLFSVSFKELQKQTFLTECPKSINDEYKVIITKEVISKNDVLEVLQNAAEKQIWKFKTDEALLDDVFPIDPQFIPETDPTGCSVSDGTVVPIESSMYGSNFSGNYY
jgi:hypothetical protein